MNKGTHDQFDLEEFEKVDVLNLLELVEKLEKIVNEFKIEVSCTKKEKL